MVMIVASSWFNRSYSSPRLVQRDESIPTALLVYDYVVFAEDPVEELGSRPGNRAKEVS